MKNEVNNRFYYKKDRLNQLRGFIATVQNDCCASKAAIKLNLEPATIGKQIKALERDLGIKLFDLLPNKKRIITQEGQIFYNEALLKLQSIDSLFLNFSKILNDNKHNHINIACHPNVAYQILPKAISKFREKNPNVIFRIEITPFEASIDNLLNNKIDFIIFPIDDNKKNKQEFNYDYFYEDKLMLVMHKNHWLANKPDNEITKDDIAKSNLVCMDEKLFETHDYLNFLLNNENFVNNIIFKDANWEIVKSMIKKNLCVAPISDTYIDKLDKEILVVKEIDFFPSFKYCILTKKFISLDNCVKNFIRLIKENFLIKINDNMEIKYTNKYVGELKIIPIDCRIEEDIELSKEIICDEEIMKTAASFNRQSAKNKKDIDYFLKISTAYGKNIPIKTCKIINNKNEIIGIIGIFTIKENFNNPEIAEIEYFLKKEYRNKHITTEISEILLNNIFEKYPNIKIVGDNLIENKISQRILLKLGFKFEKKVINNKGAIINIFKLHKNDFLNRKNNNIDIEKELKFIENYPETTDKVDSFVL